MESYKDLLEYLWTKVAAKMHQTPMQEVTVEEFINGCREVLQENQPVGVDPLTVGLGLRLQDSTVVPVVALPETPAATEAPVVAITRPKPGVVSDGMQPTFSIGVTNRT